MKNRTTVTITNNDVDSFFDTGYIGENDITFKNVTKVSIGRKLIWVEYLEELADPGVYAERYRAYGRDEFANVIVQTDDDFSIFPVRDQAYTRFQYLADNDNTEGNE